MSSYKTVFDFLKKLKNNNNREWFHANKEKFVNAQTSFEEIVQDTINNISAFDDKLEGTAAKDCIYRIYRDIRFSNDKTPYKLHLGGVMAPGGKKSKNAFYYLRLQPGNQSFIAGGMYMPEGEALKKIRQEIDYNADAMRKILSSKKFVDYFGEMEGDQLKKAPKGYDPADPNIDLLKYKSFLMVHNFQDKEVLDSKFSITCLKMFKEMKPLNDFLNMALD